MKDSRAFIILFFLFAILIYLGFEFSKREKSSTLQKNFQKSKRARIHEKLPLSLCPCVCTVRISKKEHDNDKDDDDFLLAHLSFEFFVRVSVVWYFKEQQQLSARRRKRKEATEKTTSASSGRSGWEKE